LSDPEIEHEASNSNYWEELPCGVYGISIDGSRADGYPVGEVRKHEWMNSTLKELIEWERKLIEPNHDDSSPYGSLLLSGDRDLLSAFANGKVFETQNQAVQLISCGCTLCGYFLVVFLM